MKQAQLAFDVSLKLKPFEQRAAHEVLKDIRQLMAMHSAGLLGGERMPEDVHPDLHASSAELAHYFTFGMALNYQRNSYALWRSCTAAWEDETTRWVFIPNSVNARSIDDLRSALVGHRVALQPNNHVKIWHTIAGSLCRLYEGDVRRLFSLCRGSIAEIKAALAREKKLFPYLSGTKISNYWLYVMLGYTQNDLCDRHALNVAPDTHVINASKTLGIISGEEAALPLAQELVADRWSQLLAGSEFDPIDVHTPLWLWSRSGFRALGD